MKFQKTLISLFVMSTLSACGGSGSDDNSSGSDTSEPGNTITATFVDSAIAGLEYQCDTSQGVTNSAGEFTIVEGESCSFSINGFNIGETDKISATNLIVTPYDTAENAENAVKIAAILQTIDTDGDPSNGIDIASFKKQIPTDILHSENEAEFIECMVSEMGISESLVVGLTQAKDHLDESISDAKGYHSLAVQEIIEDIVAISSTIETVNYAEKLAEYQAILAAGDDSTNGDIEVLQSVIAIAEIINRATILTRLDISVSEDPLFDYTATLPKFIDFSTQEQADYIFKFAEKVTGTSDDVAAIVYDYSLALIDLSDKLGKSFSDEHYVAMYSKNSDWHIDYQDAQMARIAALSAANKLSLLAAYDIGSDEFFVPKRETLEGIPVLKVDDTGYEYQDEYLVFEVDSRSVDYDPKSYLDDSSTLTLRQDEKYLTTAKDALTQLSTLAKTIDLAMIDGDVAQEEYANEINKLYTHMHAVDGNASPLVVVVDDAIYTVNLHAFYNLSTGLEKDDVIYNTDYMFECDGEGSVYDPKLSKIVGEPMCEYTESQTAPDFENFPYLYDDLDGNRYYLKALPTVDNSYFDLNSVISDLDEIILSCEKEDDNGKKVSCTPQ